MAGAVMGGCRRSGCGSTIPAGLAGVQLCLDHFLDEAFERTEEALQRCRRGCAMKPADIEWLLSDALATVKSLEESADTPKPEQRDRMLELLLVLANLHEYVAHHSIRLERLA